MSTQRGRPKKVEEHDKRTEEIKNVGVSPISVSSVLNKNGVLTLYVLFSDGTLKAKGEDEQQWREISLS